MNWERLIAERDVWVEHNFPGEPQPESSLFGVIEELGELAHAHLKQSQGIRGEEHEAEAQDAIGDLTIYLLGFMGHFKYIPYLKNHHPLSARAPKVSPLGLLAHRVGALAITPGSRIACSRLVNELRSYCHDRDWSYEDIVLETWERVKQRDWIKFPDTGLPDGGTKHDQ